MFFSEHAKECKSKSESSSKEIKDEKQVQIVVQSLSFDVRDTIKTIHKISSRLQSISITTQEKNTCQQLSLQLE